MARFQRRMLAPINTIKHYVQLPIVGVASGASTSFLLSNAVAKGAARANTSDVEEGAVIKSIYLEVWLHIDDANGTITGAFYKRPSGVTDITNAEMSTLQSYANKHNIFEVHQGLGPSSGNIIPMFRGWYKIPKGKQRQGLGDIITTKYAFAGSAGDVCGFCTYKEYE